MIRNINMLSPSHMMKIAWIKRSLVQFEEFLDYQHENKEENNFILAKMALFRFFDAFFSSSESKNQEKLRSIQRGMKGSFESIEEEEKEQKVKRLESLLNFSLKFLKLTYFLCHKKTGDPILFGFSCFLISLKSLYGLDNQEYTWLVIHDKQKMASLDPEESRILIKVAKIISMKDGRNSIWQFPSLEELVEIWTWIIKNYPKANERQGIMNNYSDMSHVSFEDLREMANDLVVDCKSKFSPDDPMIFKKTQLNSEFSVETNDGFNEPRRISANFKKELDFLLKAEKEHWEEDFENLELAKPSHNYYLLTGTQMVPNFSIPRTLGMAIEVGSFLMETSPNTILGELKKVEIILFS